MTFRPGRAARCRAGRPTTAWRATLDFTWPHAPTEDGGTLDLSHVLPRGAHQEDAVYLSDLEAGWYAVTSARRGLGFGQVWSLDVFPYAILWAVYDGTPGYPWYRQNYNLAMEPQSSIPEGLDEAIQAGTALTLDGGASLELSLKTVVFTGMAGVAHISPQGEVTPRQADGG